MQINTKAFQDAVMDGNFATENFTTTPDQLKQQGLDQALAPVFAAVDQAIADGKLIQASLTIESPEPTIIRLETGVINLPFADAKKIINFLEPEEMAELRLYLIVISPDVNASGLRIDEVTTLDDYTATKSAQQAAIVAEGMAKLQVIEENHNRPKPEPEPEKKPAAKKPARKTTTRKTTARKTTARKTTTRKTTTRKSTGK